MVSFGSTQSRDRRGQLGAAGPQKEANYLSADVERRVEASRTVNTGSLVLFFACYGLMMSNDELI